VPLDHESRAARQNLDDRLDLALRKLHHPPAGSADQVMTVTLGCRGIVPMPVIDVDTLYQSEAVEEVDGAIDARQTDPRCDAQRPTVDLGDREMHRRGGDDLEDGSAGFGQSETTRSKRAMQ